MRATGWLDRWLRLVGRKPHDEVAEELEFHLEERVRENVDRGMDPRAAREAALARLGDLGGIRSECTELLSAQRSSETRRDRLNVSWLDFKLGVRMLAKYPAVTLVGGIAMAFGIAAGATTFELIRAVTDPGPPFDGGERVVGIVKWNGLQADSRLLHNYATWRESLELIEDIGAYQVFESNLAAEGAIPSLAVVAATDASAFRIAGPVPHLGRTLIEEDEHRSSEPVVVFSHAVWKDRFMADPDIVGRRVHLDGAAYTVVGVMPEGYLFPHGEVWVPFRLDPLDYQVGEGPEVFVFGRVREGASLGAAQAELASLALAAVPEGSETRALEPEVLPYMKALFGSRATGPLTIGLYSANLIGVVFLALICANVGILVFARTAARENELVIRSALGASRARILGQLFAEALVLGGIAAVIGMFGAAGAIRWILHILRNELPPHPVFDMVSLTMPTIVYATALTLLAATIVGVLPALKFTRGGEGSRLRKAAAGSRLRFGGIWTGAIVIQVAVCTFALLILLDVALDARAIGGVDQGFPEEEYLAVGLEMNDQSPDAEGSPPPGAMTFASALRELTRRLNAEPAVEGVGYGDQLPSQFHARRWLGVEGITTDSEAAIRAQYTSVDPDFFATFDADIVSGRAFDSRDLAPGARSVVVNQTFVQAELGGRNPIGRRLRYLNPNNPGRLPPEGTEPGPWYEVIGVVEDLGMTNDPELPNTAGLYHALRADSASSVALAVHVRGDPGAFAPRLRAIANSVSPSLKLSQMATLAEVKRDEMRFYLDWLQVGMLGAGILILLSFAGIYSILSFTVSRRTREIGIRSALGAARGRIVTAIFARSLAQIGCGILLGVLFPVVMSGGIHSWRGAALFGSSAAAMLAVAVLACLVPTRRALSIQPTEALRAEA